MTETDLLVAIAKELGLARAQVCLLYTSDAADECPAV